MQLELFPCITAVDSCRIFDTLWTDSSTHSINLVMSVF